jgi:hypothetical protein
MAEQHTLPTTRGRWWLPVSLVVLLGALALNLVIAINHRAGRYHGA